jgi:hypothetical protein
MSLAQYAVGKQFRMYERWWQEKVIKRGTLLNYLNEPTKDYSTEELGEFYDGGNNLDLNVGKGEQGIEDDNSLE